MSAVARAHGGTDLFELAERTVPPLRDEDGLADAPDQRLARLTVGFVDVRTRAGADAGCASRTGTAERLHLVHAEYEASAWTHRLARACLVLRADSPERESV